jgi:organic radical activating enzyme
MENVATPNKGNLYRMPWSMNDNPIGWIEVTDICNIHCEGCYRLIMGDGHKPLQQIKDEILFLKKWRNCDGISMAGGEPVIHPDILEIIRFITDNGMKSVMLTNGFALNEEKLHKLKEAGLTGLSFHIDSTQTRPEFKKEKIESEAQLNDLRLKFAKLVKKSGIRYAHFGMTVHRDNLQEVPDFIQWAIDNADYVNGISLITYRGLPDLDGLEYCTDKGENVSFNANSLGYAIPAETMKIANVPSQEVYGVIKRHFPGYNATSYLGGTMDHTSLKWLIGNLITNNKGRVFGSYGKKTIELAQVVHHLLYSKYLVYPKMKMGKRIFIMGLFDKEVRKAFKNYLLYCLGNPLRCFHPVKAIGIGIIQGPDLLPDGSVDMCDDCPDMCVHEGKLVNSCRLDECRKFGSMLHVHVNSRSTKEILEKHHEVGKLSPVE